MTKELTGKALLWLSGTGLTYRANPPLRSWFTVLRIRLQGHTGAVWSENINVA